MLQIWAGAPWRLGQAAINDSFECFSQFVRLTKDVPELYVPKRHMLMHMLRRSIYQGNPRKDMNWGDEAANKTLKALCRQLSQQTFDLSVLTSMHVKLDADAPSRKRLRVT